MMSLSISSRWNNKEEVVFSIDKFLLTNNKIGEKTAFRLFILVKKSQIDKLFFLRISLDVETENSMNIIPGYFIINSEKILDLEVQKRKNVFQIVFKKDQTNEKNFDSIVKEYSKNSSENIPVEIYIPGITNPKMDSFNIRRIYYQTKFDILYELKGGNVSFKLETPIYFFEVEQYCKTYPIGFMVKGFRIKLYNYPTSEIKINISSPHEDIISFFPENVTFKIGTIYSEDIYIGISAPFYRKNMLIRIKMLDRDEKPELALKNIEFQFKDYFNDELYNFEKLEESEKLSNCYPGVKVIPNQISSVVDRISLPIKISFNIKPWGTLQFKNPFSYLKPNLKIESYPDYVTFTHDEPMKIVHINFKSEFKYIELEINHQLKVQLLIDLNKLNELIEHNLYTNPQKNKDINSEKMLNDQIERIGEYLTKNLHTLQTNPDQEYRSNISLITLESVSNLFIEIIADDRIIYDKSGSKEIPLTHLDLIQQTDQETNYYYYYKNFFKVKLKERLQIISSQPIEICFLAVEEFAYNFYKDFEKLQILANNCFNYEFASETYFYEHFEKYYFYFIRDTSETINNGNKYLTKIFFHDLMKVKKNLKGFLFIQNLVQDLFVVNVNFHLELNFYDKDNSFIINLSNNYFYESLQFVINTNWKKENSIEFLELPEKIIKLYNPKPEIMKNQLLEKDGIINIVKNNFIYLKSKADYINFITKFSISNPNYFEEKKFSIISSRKQKYKFIIKKIFENKIDLFLKLDNDFVFKNYLFDFDIKIYICDSKQNCEFYLLIKHNRESYDLEFMYFRKKLNSFFLSFELIENSEDTKNFWSYFYGDTFQIPFTIDSLKVNKYYHLKSEICWNDHFFSNHECFYNEVATLEFFTYQIIYLEAKKKTFNDILSLTLRFFSLLLFIYGI